VRFDIRSRFVASVQRSYERLVAQLHRKFCTPISEISAFQGKELADTAYTALLKDGDWRCNVNVGPMTKDEWFQAVRHERAIFQEEPERGTFWAFKSTFPERFVYLDVDMFRENIELEVVLRVFRAKHNECLNLAQRLVDYCRG
jgi:hypothetical protein